MAITSLDILNLSHSLKDICEVNCNTPECLSQALKILMQYNLLRANMEFGRQLEPICPKSACQDASAVSGSAPQKGVPGHCTRASNLTSAHGQTSRTPLPGYCTYDPNPASVHGQALAVPDGTASPTADAPHGTDIPAPPTPPSRPPIRLDIADPFLADYEK